VLIKVHSLAIPWDPMVSYTMVSYTIIRLTKK